MEKKPMISLKGLMENRNLVLVLLAIVVVASFILLYTGDNNGGAQKAESNNTWNVFNSGGDSRLSDFEMVLSQIDGAGTTRAYITYESDGVKESNSVKGIVIVSQGAGDFSVRIKLLNAASTAFGVPADRIEVFEMKKGEQP